MIRFVQYLIAFCLSQHVTTHSYTLQGKYTEAESLVASALATQEKIYGSEHHLIVPTLLTMAEIHNAKGQYKQAEKLVERALALAENTENLQERISKIRELKKATPVSITKVF